MSQVIIGVGFGQGGVPTAVGRAIGLCVCGERVVFSCNKRERAEIFFTHQRRVLVNVMANTGNEFLGLPIKGAKRLLLSVYR